MSDHQPAAQDKEGNSFIAELDRYAPNFADALPAHIPFERFKRVLITAVSTNPDLLYANRRSLFTSAMKCATDGLIPDGREAVLVKYSTEVKQRDPSTGLDVKRRMDMISYMPMIAGIRKRLRNSGEVTSATAEAVFANDKFRYSLGDNPFIEHEPAPFGQPRGEVVGAYAIIRLANGEVVRDIIDRATIEVARHQGNAPNSLMWMKFYWEGAKKTVLKRASKQAPFSADLDRLLHRDEEVPRFEPDALAPPDEAEPVTPLRRPLLQEIVDDRPEFDITDLDGVVTTLRSGDRAAAAVGEVLREAARQGPSRLTGAWESNQATVEQLAREGSPDEAVALAKEFDTLRKAAEPAVGRTADSSQREEVMQDDDRAQVGQGPHNAQPPVAGAATPSAGDAPSPAMPQRRRRRAPGPVRDAEAARAPPDGDPHPEPAPGQRLGLSVVQQAPPAEKQQPAAADDGRESQEIAMVIRKGKPDYRTWTVALFAPRLKRQRDTAGLATLIGDNDEHLEAAKANLAREERAELDAAIKAQWAAVGQIEAGAAAGAEPGNG